MNAALYLEALDRFRDLLGQAERCELPEPNAVTLATADAMGRPSARTVLLRGIDERGFVFYTNLHSRKGQNLAVNASVALCFFWQPLMRQVNVAGRAEAVSGEEADAYWTTRPRPSQIGAWASEQSRPLAERVVLERRFRQFEQDFLGGPVPRPDHWSGFRVVPERIEFWEFRPFRLHERVCYQRVGDTWTVTLLNP
jgi:pyridoxamine 5'-phosphate oxidase